MGQNRARSQANVRIPQALSGAQPLVIAMGAANPTSRWRS